ncbi:MAG: hypothetical protein IJ748_04050 [Bacteroidales bacterium]|nr:hypothetical protein [Bacteroidales bacterium]
MKLKILYIAVLFLVFFQSVQAQNKMQAEVTIQQLIRNKVLTIKKEIFYQSNGHLVTHITQPQEIIIISNSLGEISSYFPATDEAFSSVSPSQSSKNEVFAVFSSNERNDLGLSSLGFEMKQQERDSTRIVKTYIPTTENKEISRIIMVYDNDLPIYCGYFNKENKENKKIYYQDYIHLPKFSMPTNITEISVMPSNDTIIRRQIFSSVKCDKEAVSEYFEFRIPDSAKMMEGIKIE